MAESHASPHATARGTWASLNAAHAFVAHGLTAALRQHHNLSINSHAVLAVLLVAPEHKLRMTEIAHQIGFSLSGLTGLVGRLEVGGLIERQANFADRRVVFAQLTELGERCARESSAAYEATLGQLFNAALSEGEMRQLIGLLSRLSPAVAGPAAHDAEHLDPAEHVTHSPSTASPSLLSIPGGR